MFAIKRLSRVLAETTSDTEVGAWGKYYPKRYDCGGAEDDESFMRRINDHVAVKRGRIRCVRVTIEEDK